MPVMKTDLDVVPHLDSLWRYARVLTRSDADADDLLQDALARAIRLSGSYDTRRPLLNWLIVILRNTYFSSRKRFAAEQQRIEAVAVRDATQPVQEQSADLGKVMAAFEALAPDQREVLQMVAVLGFSYTDAADALGIPVGTVMSRLNRGRAALKARLGYEAKDGASPKFRVVGGSDGQG
jgi:RNA polymerase sigma factor (sigma-70 family)